MDGWETRRKRVPGHDFCLIKLACPATITGVEINTAYFTGNHAPKVSIQASDKDLKIERTPALGAAADGKSIDFFSYTQVNMGKRFKIKLQRFKENIFC